LNDFLYIRQFHHDNGYPAHSRSWAVLESGGFSELRNPENRCFSPDGTLKMRIRFVQFGEILGCKTGKDEELKGLKERAGDKVLQNMGTLLESQALSDLKIKTSDGKLFQAHKSIHNSKPSGDFQCDKEIRDGGRVGAL
jgi:hypothetical protein